MVACSLFLGAAGCGGEGGDDGLPEGYRTVAGTRLCGGRAVSPEASRALKVITGSSRFEASAKEYGVARAARHLVEAFPAPTSDEDVCRVFTPLGAPETELRVLWSLEESAPTGASDPKFTVLRMGDKTLAAADAAMVFFPCRSDRLSHASRVGHVVIDVRRWGMPKPPEGDVQALKDAYATVAHSFALAMARELRCEDDGGLPARPVLDPA
jgi:hypothetical protein